MKQFCQSALLVAALMSTGAQSFSVPAFTRQASSRQTTRHRVLANSDLMDDQTLLQQVEESQLQDLCTQCNLDATGGKLEMLKRLRDYAAQQAEVERLRRMARVARVEDGEDGNKQKYEVVSEVPDEDDDGLEDDGYFYFELPEVDAKVSELKARQELSREESGTKLPKPAYMTQASITAPPVPDVEPNEDGERIVTVYNTQDQNDLTGVAAAQPNAQQYSNDAMMNGPGNAPQPWEISNKSAASDKELEKAKEILQELVHSLLALSGAPAFQEEFSEGIQMYSEKKMASQSASPKGFVGFDPSKLPPDILASSSRALRAGRGKVLEDILREYELRAVGHDGMAGDNIEKGGGHYREVNKVRAFLEGYRKAEVRRVARETTTMLLDKLASEGVQGLDFMLASMTKASDDLVEYLGDAIRQQEKKIGKMIKEEQLINPEIDMTANLWEVTEENGQRYETLDPSNPEVQRVMAEEQRKSQAGPMATSIRDKAAPEQILILLNLLRDRIKAEAAFSNDEKGRNLRILAYCLNFESDNDRKMLLMKEMKNSMEVSPYRRQSLCSPVSLCFARINTFLFVNFTQRIESFAELVSSSIDYAESTSHQLQPAKGSKPLNVNLLKRIHKMAQDIRDDQAYQASGVV
jgi:hypothetical protein